MSPPIERISMTIPVDVRRRADQLAKAWDRPRSWVLAEAVRRLDGPSAERAQPAVLDESRRRQLKDDIRLSVGERVHVAERTAREAARRGFARLFVSFDSAEDYYRWKDLESTGQV